MWMKIGKGIRGSWKDIENFRPYASHGSSGSTYGLIGKLNEKTIRIQFSDEEMCKITSLWMEYKNRLTGGCA